MLAAARIRGTIVEAATVLFLRDGFGATSMEAVAAAAGVSKRTLYSRFADKSALLESSVAWMVGDWLPDFDAVFEPSAGADLASVLAAAGDYMLAAALAPPSLALYRLLVAEAGRVPDLAGLLAKAGAGSGIARIARLLAKAGVGDPGFAAEQFQRLVLTGPQHRALGLGPPMDAAEIRQWPARCVALLLHGCGAVGGAGATG